MNIHPGTPRGSQLLWPLAGVTLGALVAVNPLVRPQLVPPAGGIVWLLDAALVLTLAPCRASAKAAVLIAGLFLSAPCFLRAPPWTRFFLMCALALPFVIACWRLLAPPDAGSRERLRFFFSWLGTRQLRRQRARWDLPALGQLLAATVVLAVGIQIGNAVSTPESIAQWLTRWLSGGVTVLAFAEMVTTSHMFWTALMGLESPALMRSPHRSVSLREFWSERWNPAASALLFRPYFFAPVVRHGVGLALFTAFLGSALVHMLLLVVAGLSGPLPLMWGAFFIAQPLLIAIERRIRLRSWRVGAQRVWTFTALGVCSPLVIEPVLQLVEPTWDASNGALVPTARILGLAVILNLCYALGTLAAVGRAEVPPEVPRVAP